MFGKKKSRKPQDEDSLMRDAVADLFRDQQRKERRKRKRRLRWPEWLDKRIVVGLAVILVVIIGDAVRRENTEFFATVTNAGGRVTARVDESTPPVAVEINKTKLADGAMIATAPGAWAELSFPDGSKVVVDGGSELKVKLLEYSRGGRWRSRSFLLNTGRVFARIGENYGKESELRVFTPACVAAARGTRFSVTADPNARTSQTLCNDGTVEVRGFNGSRMFVNRAGVCSTRTGEGPALPQTVDPATLAPFRQASLNQPVEPYPWYHLAELTLTQTLNAPLTLLGVGKCSWWAGSLDAARRSACQDALRKININLEGDTSYPYWVNPATLAELDIKEVGGVDHILRNFDGAAIESYRSDGRTYLIIARARDRARTRYEADQTGPRKSADQS